MRNIAFRKEDDGGRPRGGPRRRGKPAIEVASRILDELVANPGGLTEARLQERDDPVEVTRILERLVGAGTVDLHLDNKQAGGLRRRFVLARKEK